VPQIQTRGTPYKECLCTPFCRVKARRGAKKAIAFYHMLKDGTTYQDLGPHHFDCRSKERQIHDFVKRLVDLGYTVTLAPTLALFLARHLKAKPAWSRWPAVPT
jgi:hypothetical protein